MNPIIRMATLLISKTRHFNKCGKISCSIRYFNSLKRDINKDGKSIIKETYQDYVENCLERAHRSVLIRNDDSIHAITQSCQTFGGKIVRIDFVPGQKAIALVEFERKESIDNITKIMQYFPNDGQIQNTSRVLYLNSNRPKKKILEEVKDFHTQIHHSDSINPLVAELQQYSSLEQQIDSLYRDTKLSELGLRTRFFACSIVEEVIKGILPYGRVRPFGSVVSGLGMKDCDIDLVLFPDNEAQEKKKQKTYNFFRLTGMNTEGKKITKAKNQTEGKSKTPEVGILYCVTGVMKYLRKDYFVKINPIFRARVPIVKFQTKPFSIECDLCVATDHSQTRMAELCYCLGEKDERFKKIVIIAKLWAKSNGITNKANTSGPFSNFMLVALVIHYLQATEPPIFPSLGDLCLALESDEPKDGISEVSSWSKINNETTAELLLGFFNYYGEMDFTQFGVNLLDPKSSAKKDDKPIYIQNPFDSERNVAQNVTNVFLNEFQTACKASYESFHLRDGEVSNTDRSLSSILPLKTSSSLIINAEELLAS